MRFFSHHHERCDHLKIYIFGNVRRHKWFGSGDLNIGESRVWRLESRVWRLGESRVWRLGESRVWRLVHPEPWGFMIQSDGHAYFSDGLVKNHQLVHQKLNGTESQRTPFSKLVELLDTQVFSGSVQYCWRFLGTTWRIIPVSK